MYKNYFKFTVIITYLFLSITLVNAATRIMPLGDSITKGEWVDDTRDDSEITGYRGSLWHKLNNAGFEAQFVGGEDAGYSISPPFDSHHEGHPSISSRVLEDSTYEYVANAQPDTILLHIGTNDHRSDAANMEEGVIRILDHIDTYERDQSEVIKVFVAMIIDRRKHDPIIAQFNENLKVIVGERIRNGDNLTLINMYGEVGLTSADYADNTHPNDSGYRKMAQVWYNALIGPETPGLYAYPYTLVDKYFIVSGSMEVDDASSVVAFTTAIPDNGIVF